MGKLFVLLSLFSISAMYPMEKGKDEKEKPFLATILRESYLISTGKDEDETPSSYKSSGGKDEGAPRILKCNICNNPVLPSHAILHLMIVHGIERGAAGEQAHMFH